MIRKKITLFLHLEENLLYFLKKSTYIFSGSDSYNTFNCSFLLLLVLCNICHHTFVTILLYKYLRMIEKLWLWYVPSNWYGEHSVLYIDLQTTNSFKKESILPSTTTACVLVWFLVFLHLPAILFVLKKIISYKKSWYYIFNYCMADLL